MKTPFLVIGSGIAGMSVALHLSELGEVILLSKTELVSGSTALAQGGIAGEREKHSFPSYVSDTIRTGSGINSEEAVSLLVSQSWQALSFLQRNGVVFDDTLHTEAGHSKARVWHIADETGLFIAQKLAERVRASESITLFENAFAVDLLVRDGAVFGVDVFHENERKRIFALKTILATGGAGQIFLETTNPIGSTGDGIAVGVRAGVRLKDMEFVQFHPTALATEDSPLFLLSEALRGEGAKVVDGSGKALCKALLPRDTLSRTVFQAEKQEAVYLDLRHKKNDFWKERFPNIFAKLKEYSLSPEEALIPVVPAAHFFCGGIETDLHGRTNIKNLFAVGEVACTGVHGANRMASNSLLEGLVFSEQIYRDISQQCEKGEKIPSFSGHFETSVFQEDSAEDEEIRKSVQRICWEKVGIIRNEKNINEAISQLSQYSPTGTETKNLLSVALFVAEAARKRKTSLGCHWME
jgi:L-aspartate oxidase